ncbi:hypothetical protein [Streptomyces sp. CS090A]|uniref:hypothetical protein n=1 Tax=Streptomyces sp. CS090A TaxID=2162710 RepID=UPI0013A54ABD|nr:hypothetical protein [Streptomyces sp. CS090A]
MPVVSELYDAAVLRLNAVAREPLNQVSRRERAALVERLDHLLAALAEQPAPLDPISSSATDDVRSLLASATGHVRTAARYLPSPAPRPGPAADHLTAAAAAVSAVRDTIASHRDHDGRPVTPYAYTYSDRAARDYLTRRTAELAFHAGRAVHVVAQGAHHPGIPEALDRARSDLNQAAVYGQAGTRSADSGAGALPLALPVEPVQTSDVHLTAHVPGRIAEDCDRLSRSAYETAHALSHHTLSGSDLQHIARWQAMSRLLAGRVLLRVADQHPDQSTASGMREAADHLRTTARAWQQAASTWHHVVDLADPSAHPKLPPPSYDIVRRGEVVQLPQVVPHPAAVLTRTTAVRLGQLLYGPKWTPEGAKQPRPEPRTAAEILADSRGEGPLAATLYRLPATGWQLATATPTALENLRHRLVTDSIDHRLAQHDPRRRFYPATGRQIEHLHTAYAELPRAETAAAAALLSVAERVGTAVPRAHLDATAHQQITSDPTWRRAPASPPAPGHAAFTRAARSVSVATTGTSPLGPRRAAPLPAAGRGPVPVVSAQHQVRRR